MRKGTKLYSVRTGTCPRCQEDKIFVFCNPYDLGNFMKMHERCGHCGFKYELETGFFYGSMYVNYALAIAVSVAVLVITKLFYPLEVTPYLIVNGIALLLLSPVIYRLGRIIWLNIFVKYDPKVGIKQESDAHPAPEE